MFTWRLFLSDFVVSVLLFFTQTLATSVCGVASESQ